MSDKVGRKVCEVHLAVRIERELDKREILEMYLNQIYLGAGSVRHGGGGAGVLRGAGRELDAGQAALLVGLAQEPGRATTRAGTPSGRSSGGTWCWGHGGAGRDRPRHGGGRPWSARWTWRRPWRRRARAVLRGRGAAGAAGAVRPRRRRLGLRVYTGLDPRSSSAWPTTRWSARSSGSRAATYGRYSHATGRRPERRRRSSRGWWSSWTPRPVRCGRWWAGGTSPVPVRPGVPGAAPAGIGVQAAGLRGRAGVGPPATARLETRPWPWRRRVARLAAGRPRGGYGPVPDAPHGAGRVVEPRGGPAGPVGGRAAGRGMGRRLGLSTPIPPYPSIHLGRRRSSRQSWWPPSPPSATAATGSSPG
jgi:hypothetical protein